MPDIHAFKFAGEIFEIVVDLAQARNGIVEFGIGQEGLTQFGDLFNDLLDGTSDGRTIGLVFAEAPVNVVNLII
jgi:hypothetical protein